MWPVDLTPGGVRMLEVELGAGYVWSLDRLKRRCAPATGFARVSSSSAGGGRAGRGLPPGPWAASDCRCVPVIGFGRIY